MKQPVSSPIKLALWANSLVWEIVRVGENKDLGVRRNIEGFWAPASGIKTIPNAKD